MNTILIMGLQGSGKSTQTEMIKAKYGYVSICAGDLLRQHIADGTEFGKSYQAAYERGEFAPSSVTCGIMGQALDECTDDAKIILDGFPRNHEQLHWLEKNYEIDRCILLEVSKDLAVKRLLGRGRKDDNEKAIQKRFSLYEKETMPVTNYYGEQGKLYTISADFDADTIFSNISNIFDT